jgi:protein TonB
MRQRHLQSRPRATDHPRFLPAAPAWTEEEPAPPWAPLALATALHVALLSLAAPWRSPAPPPPAPERAVFRLEEHRFRPSPPPPQPSAPTVVTRPARAIPVPADLLDPAPAAPVAALPELSLPPLALATVVPPPPPPVVESPPGPRAFRPLSMTPPARLAGRDPRYTEVARRARLEGVVIVRATIDEQGQLLAAELVRDLGLGLGSETLAALATWRFAPATEAGRPVAVHYMLTVRFSLDGGASRRGGGPGGR